MNDAKLSAKNSFYLVFSWIWLQAFNDLRKSFVYDGILKLNLNSFYANVLFLPCRKIRHSISKEKILSLLISLFSFYHLVFYISDASTFFSQIKTNHCILIKTTFLYSRIIRKPSCFTVVYIITHSKRKVLCK